MGVVTEVVGVLLLRGVGVVTEGCGCWGGWGLFLGGVGVVTEGVLLLRGCCY